MFMNRNKQTVKPCNNMMRSSFLSRVRCTLANLFFRDNNLLFALISAKLRNNKIILGNHIVLRHCRFIIHGSGNTIVIGDNCTLSGVRVYSDSSNNKLTIGRNTTVNADKRQMTLFNPCGEKEITVGEYCLFSNNVELHTTDYHKILSDGKQTNQPQNIVIGSHCWIGLQSLILKGTVLADNIIVGAKSLVNQKFEDPDVIIAGNPAKIIKYGVAWES